jgi:hypothetical protein
VSGDPQDEVARSLGLSDNALRQLLHRARVTVRAAATAITPLPFLTWFAGSSRGSLAERIAELAAGAAPAGATATLAKAGTVAVLAGGVFTGPAVIDNVTDHAPKRASIAAEARAASRPVHTSTSAAPHRAAAVPVTTGAVRQSRPAARRAPDGAGEAIPERRRSHPQRDEGDREDSDDAEDRRGANRRGGSPLGDDERHESDEADEDRSGPGGGEESESEPADEAAGDEGGSSSSGEGMDEAHSQPVPVPAETPEPDEELSGPPPVPTATPDPHDDE